MDDGLFTADRNWRKSNPIVERTTLWRMDLENVAQAYQTSSQGNILLRPAVLLNLALLIPAESKIRVPLSNTHPLSSVFFPATLEIMVPLEAL